MNQCPIAVIQNLQYTDVTALRWNMSFPESNPDTRIYHIRDGGGSYTAGAKHDFFRRKCFYLLPQRMSLRLSTPDRMGVFWSHIRLYDPSGVDYFQLYKPEPIELSNVPAELAENFDDLAERGLPGDLAGQLHGMSVIYELLGQFWRKQPPESIADDSGNNQKIRRLALHISRSSWMDQPDCAELAQRCGMGESAFFVEFKRCFGMTPAHYFRRNRLEKARMLLLRTSDKLQNIAEETGFHDAFHLSKLFKSEFGVSPNEYRKKQQFLP